MTGPIPNLTSPQRVLGDQERGVDPDRIAIAAGTGQLVEAVPDLDLVVAVSSMADPAEFDPDAIADLVSSWIEPAVAG
jgi:hypothetical protein